MRKFQNFHVTHLFFLKGNSHELFQSLIIPRHKTYFTQGKVDPKEWVNCAWMWQEGISTGACVTNFLANFNTSWLISFRSITKRFYVWCHATKMLWIFIIIILRSRTIDETFIILLLAFDVSVYLSSSKSLVKKKINHVVFQAWFLMTLKMFYCRQFSLSSLMNKSFLLKMSGVPDENSNVKSKSICHWINTIILCEL